MPGLFGFSECREEAKKPVSMGGLKQFADAVVDTDHGE